MKPQRDVVAHEYDGIEEFDNPTPGWWHLIFAATIVFSIFYYAFWHFSPLAWTPEQALRDDQTRIEAKKFGSIGDLANDVPTLLRLMGDEKLLRVADGMFQMNCASCHGREGGGINGVNLCDDSYKNAKSITDLADVIAKGAANGAMPAWENRLSDKQRILLAAYVASLRGKSPANPRQPEGVTLAPWPSAAPQ